MNKYTSQNRIMSPARIEQPTPPRTRPVQKEFYNTKIDTKKKVTTVITPNLELPTSKPTVDFTDPSSSVAAKVAWLKEHNYAVLPEITTIKDMDTVPGLAIVVAHYGSDEIRYKANDKALSRLAHSHPRPELMIFVEYVEEGKESHYENDDRWDVVLTRTIDEEAKTLFQKEPMWTLGANYAFSREGITKCIFLDADCAWEDNSWAYYCDHALNRYDFIQPYSGIYYSEQYDIIENYAKYGMYLSAAYAFAHDLPRGTPGGAYGCTKTFFYDVLDSKWPISAVGSGDAAFWLYLRGKAILNFLPIDYDIKLSTENGNFPDCKIGYANLIMIHFYHGPMSNRMYTTRHYCIRKCSITPESEVQVVNDVLKWADTKEGEMMKEMIPVLKRMTNEKVAQGSKLTITELKPEFKKVAEKVYGKLTLTKDPLIIVTYCGHGSEFKESNIVNMKRDLDRYCKTPFLFYVAADYEIECADKTFIIPTHRKHCAGEWNRMHIFGFEFRNNENILFLDPSISIVDNFSAEMSPIEYFHMARPYGRIRNKYRQTWDSDMMYFRGGVEFKRIYEQFLEELEKSGVQDPEYQFIDPTDYISHKVRKYRYIRNIIAHFDYMYSNEKSNKDGIEFILEP